MRIRAPSILAAVAAAVLAAPAAQAATIDLTGGGSVPLSQLLAGDDVRVGDKVFYDFGNYSSIAFGGASPANPALIAVLAIPAPPPGEIGIRFQTTQWSVTSGQLQDTQFEFFVAPDPGHLIHDITLTTSGGATYDGSWAVTETAIPGAGALTFQVTNPPPGPDNITATVHKVFPPTPLLRVLKDIALDGGTLTTGAASISSVDQSFSQVAVPLPAAMPAGALLLGLLAAKRIRRET